MIDRDDIEGVVAYRYWVRPSLHREPLVPGFYCYSSLQLEDIKDTMRYISWSFGP